MCCIRYLQHCCCQQKKESLNGKNVTPAHANLSVRGIETRNNKASKTTRTTKEQNLNPVRRLARQTNGEKREEKL